MRAISCEEITEAVAALCVEANCLVSPDITAALKAARRAETGELPRQVLGTLLENGELAAREGLPICQDTGLAVVFAQVGQEVHVMGGGLTAAINAGVALGYQRGYLRKSVVADPVRRENTRDNTPAIIHYDIVPGDGLRLTVAPKGFGSENMSALKMLKPYEGLAGVKDFILRTVESCGPNPCPPMIVGCGVGGNFEGVALLAKKALLRPVGSPNPDPFWGQVEEELLGRINALGLGPAGLGGQTTALAVFIAPAATHIAGLPVAVNIGCHVTRHAAREL